MKIQRKLLTGEQKQKICSKTDGMLSAGCLECPMAIEMFELIFCWKDIKKLQNKIDKYWNEEVTV